MVPKESDDRKGYDDRPRLSPGHDPELKEKKPNVQQPEPSAEDKAQVDKMKVKVQKAKVKR